MDINNFAKYKVILFCLFCKSNYLSVCPVSQTICLFVCLSCKSDYLSVYPVSQTICLSVCLSVL